MAPKRSKIPPLPPEEAKRLTDLADSAIHNFEGQLDELESALGMLLIGRHFGWRVLVLIHNKRTIRKYEELLGIEVRKYFPEITPASRRSFGYKIVEGAGNFWKAVSGDIPVEGRREIAKG